MSGGGVSFPGCEIYYNYAFDLGGVVSPVDVARRLLAADIGVAFRNYETGCDEICSDLGGFAENYWKLVSVHEAMEQLESGDVGRALLRLVRVDAREAGRSLVRGVWRAVFRGREGGEKEDVGEEGDSTDQVRQMMEEAELFFAGLVQDRAIHEYVDRTVFHEDYLEGIPFTRVELHPFAATVGGEALDLGVTAMIHRSGVCVLAARLVIPREIGADEIIGLERFSRLEMSGGEFPSAVLWRYLQLLYGEVGKSALGAEEGRAVEGRTGYLEFKGEQGVVLAGVLDAYRYSIVEVASGRRGRSLSEVDGRLRCRAWFGYPIVFLRLPDVTPAGAAKFVAARAGELARLVLGYTGGSSVRRQRTKEILGDDLSLTDSYSLYLTEGSATVLNYGDVAEGVPAEAAANETLRMSFLTTVVIDVLMVQRMIMRIFMERLNLITSDRAGLVRLREIKRDLLGDLEEFEALGLSHFGSVTDIIKRGREVLRLNEMYGLFERKLAIMEAIAQAEDVGMRAAGEGAVKGVTTVVAAVLSLTAANAFVKVILGWSAAASAGWPSWARWVYALVVARVQTRPVLWTVAIYVISLVVTVMILWVRAPWAVPRGRRMVRAPKPTRSRAGVVSPVPFGVRPVGDETGEGAQGEDGAEGDRGEDRGQA